MKGFYDYSLEYWRRSSKPVLWMGLLLLAILITINYTVGIERRIQGLGNWFLVYGAQAVFFGIVVTIIWGVQVRWRGAAMSKGLLRLLVVAVLLFSAKMVHWDLSPWLPGSPGSLWNRYWVIVTQLPAKLILLFGVLRVLWRVGWLAAPEGRGSRGGGIDDEGIPCRTVFGLLLLLVPLVALASTQPDFCGCIRKCQPSRSSTNIRGRSGSGRRVMSYHMGWISCRSSCSSGLLVIGVARFAGEQAILPMAAFYCTIHFGKPLAECVTSFGGGMVLGVLAYRTRSILGGLIVHLGLAWLMEVGGWVGHL